MHKTSEDFKPKSQQILFWLKLCNWYEAKRGKSLQKPKLLFRYLKISLKSRCQSSHQSPNSYLRSGKFINFHKFGWLSVICTCTQTRWEPGDYAVDRMPWKAWWQPRAWFCRRRAQLAAVTKDYCCNNKLLTQTGGNPRTRKSTCFDKRLRSSVRQPFMCYAASSSSGDSLHLLKQTADVTWSRSSQWHHGAVILFQLSPHV